MRVVLLTFCFVVAAVFGASSILPTKEEQIDLLKNVQDVFSAIKITVDEEGHATDSSVIADVERAAERAWEYLFVVRELALTKLSENSECRRDAEREVEKITDDGQRYLQLCVDGAAGGVYNNSEVVTSTAATAIDQGRALLDALNRCSKKPGLQQISCYKKAMIVDVFPLKLIFVHALNVHKSGHLEAIAIRKRANGCIDDVLDSYRAKIERALKGSSVRCDKSSSTRRR